MRRQRRSAATSVSAGARGPRGGRGRRGCARRARRRRVRGSCDSARSRARALAGLLVERREVEVGRGVARARSSARAAATPSPARAGRRPSRPGRGSRAASVFARVLRQDAPEFRGRIVQACGAHQDDAEIVPRRRVLRIDDQRALELADRFGDEPLVAIEQAEVVVDLRIELVALRAAPIVASPPSTKSPARW